MEKIFTPMLFSNIQDFTNITNVLLVDSDVQNYDFFVNCVNTTTLPIVYSQSSDRKELEEYLTKLTKIERLAFVFNDALIKSKQFTNGELFFTQTDITEQKDLSPNCQFLINLISKFNIKNVDFLVCNSLQYDNWKQYYELLKTKTGAIIGASENETGNIKYGGDWIMENTKEDVQTIYWTNQIENYTQTLVTTVSGTVNISQGFVNILSNWPVTISANATVTFGENLTLNSSSMYFIINGDNVTIDGAGYTVTINGVTNYPGLIQNGTSSSNGYSGVTVKNIGVLRSGSSTLTSNGGWVCQSYFGKETTGSATIQNCYSTGSVGQYGGGICGSDFGAFMSGTLTIQNCYSTGSVGHNGGGICGVNFGFYMLGTAKATIQNCYSTGIVGAGGGGICGFAFGSGMLGGTATIQNCYSTSSIGTEGGGICGSGFGNNMSGGTATIQNCYSTGSVGAEGGGICGSYFGVFMSGGTATIQNCYSTGSVGASGGGICGAYFGYNMTGGTATIKNCTHYGSNWYGSSSTNIPQTTSITNNQNTGWKNNLADSTIGTNTYDNQWTNLWVKFYNNSGEINYAYLLSSFNNALYSPSSQTLRLYENTNSSLAILRPDNTIYTIISVNNSNTLSTITMSNTSTGVMNFNNVPSGTYSILVIGGLQTNSIYYGYDISTFTLSTTSIYDYIPCFTLATLHKIISKIKKNTAIFVTKTKLQNKKIYKFNYGDFGELEFTEDHPFLYNSKVYGLKDLIKIHPYLKKKAILKEDSEEEFVYNIYGHYEQTHKDNQFALGNNLVMLGGKITNNKDDYDKVKSKLIELSNEAKSNLEIKEKYSLSKFLESSVDSCELYIVIV